MKLDELLALKVKELGMTEPITIEVSDKMRRKISGSNIGTKVTKQFYMTLGSGQPYYPGYFIAYARDEAEARFLTSKALNNRWCSTYEKFEDIHPLDRIYRGGILESGLEVK